MRWTRQRWARREGGRGCRGSGSAGPGPVSMERLTQGADDDAARCRPGCRFAPLASPVRAGPSRVVLMPRAGIKGRRVRASNRSRNSLSPDGDTTQSDRSPGRARSKPKKPLRAERRVFPGVSVVTNSCVTLPYTHEAMGAPAPGVPCTLVKRVGMQYLARMGQAPSAHLRRPRAVHTPGAISRVWRQVSQ